MFDNILGKVRDLATPKKQDTYYKNMREQFRSLSQHEDFGVLIEYWEREYQKVDQHIDTFAHSTTLDTVQKDDLVRSVIKRDIIRKHMMFYRNMMS